jgi:hypothetical protein
LAFAWWPVNRLRTGLPLGSSRAPRTRWVTRNRPTTSHIRLV